MDDALDDFGDELELDLDATPPDFRASVRDGRLTLLRWFNQVPLSGPLRGLAAGRDAAGVSIVDLRVSGDGAERDVSVTFEADGDRRGAERALVAWARAVGYRRIWLPDRVEELEGLPALGRAQTACNACDARWAEDEADFWAIVAAAGHFPTSCPLCGGDLPQWTVASGTRARTRPGARARSVSPALDTRERP